MWFAYWVDEDGDEFCRVFESETAARVGAERLASLKGLEVSVYCGTYAGSVKIESSVNWFKSN